MRGSGSAWSSPAGSSGRPGLGPVEVLLLEEATLRLLKRILADRLVVYSRDEPRRVAWESRAPREALDFDLHARRLDQELLRATAEGRR
jgi:hypothetical protein